MTTSYKWDRFYHRYHFVLTMEVSRYCWHRWISENKRSCFHFLLCIIHFFYNNAVPISKHLWDFKIPNQDRVFSWHTHWSWFCLEAEFAATQPEKPWSCSPRAISLSAPTQVFCSGYLYQRSLESWARCRRVWGVPVLANIPPGKLCRGEGDEKLHSWAELGKGCIWKLNSGSWWSSCGPGHKST